MELQGLGRWAQFSDQRLEVGPGVLNPTPKSAFSDSERGNFQLFGLIY